MTTTIRKMSKCHRYQGGWTPEENSRQGKIDAFMGRIKDRDPKDAPKRGGSIKPMNWTADEKRRLNAWRREYGYSQDRGGYRSTNIESLRA